MNEFLVPEMALKCLLDHTVLAFNRPGLCMYTYSRIYLCYISRFYRKNHDLFLTRLYLASH